MYGLMPLLMARVEELVADLRYFHKPTGERIAPQVIASCLPKKDRTWQEGQDFPHVLIAITEGGFDKLNPQPVKVTIGCDILTDGDTATGTDEIMEFTEAVGKIVGNRSFPPYKLRTPIRFTVGSDQPGFEGIQPHPVYFSNIYLEFIKF